MSKEDQELLDMMSGENKALHPDTVHVTLGKATETARKEARDPEAPKTAKKEAHETMDGNWEPMAEECNGSGWMGRLERCAKWVILFGGLSFLLFYWNQAGLMATSVAVPSMCVCTALAGWGLGKNVGGK